MAPDFIRLKFVEKYGNVKYLEFVLSLYEYFPKPDRLLFWQEKLINELIKELNYHQPGLEEVYNIFSYCPVHYIQLLEDNVPIINGSEIEDPFDFNLGKQLFPLANIHAPRDTKRFEYPQSIHVKYCSVCRAIRLNKINS